MIRQLILLVATVAAATPAFSGMRQDLRSSVQSRRMASITSPPTFKSTFFDRAEITAPPVSRVDAEMVTVTVKFVYDKEKYSKPNNAIFRTPDPHVAYPLWGEEGIDDYEIELPAGTYYLHAGFDNGSPDVPLTIIVKESVTVADGDVITIDASEATELYSFKPVMPDGKTIEPATCRLDASYEIVDVENPGNYTNGVFQTNVSLPGYGIMYGVFGDPVKEILADGTMVDCTKQFDVLINRCSDEVFVEYSYVVVNPDSEIIAGDLSTHVSQSTTVVNTAGDYVKTSYEYQNPPYQADDAEGHGSIDFIYSDRNHITGALTVSCKAGDVIWFSKGSVKKDVVPVFVMGGKDNFFDFEQFNPAISTKIPPVGVVEEGGDLVVPGYNYANDRMNLIWESQLDDNFKPYVNYGPMSYDNVSGVMFGNSVPFTSFMCYAAKENVPEYFASSWDWNFVGAMGEVRNGDKTNSDTRVLYNGKEIFSSYAEMNMWEWFGNNPAPGTYDINIENRNVTIDGEIPGRSVCRTHFDMAQADFQPPVLTWLQYRDKDGRLCDRFDKAEGSVIFTASKLDYQVNQDWMTHLECTDAGFDVKVMYTPHGYDDWQELSAVGNLSNFFAAGYGKYFTADLAQINRNSASGWFDLRFEFTDAAGNSQMQSIEPAFKIEALTALDRIGADTETIVVVEDGKIIAPDGSHVYNLGGIECRTTGLQPGVYIVVTPDGNSAKVIL